MGHHGGHLVDPAAKHPPVKRGKGGTGPSYIAISGGREGEDFSLHIMSIETQSCGAGETSYALCGRPGCSCA